MIDIDQARIVGTNTYFRDRISQYWRELYFTKHRDWSSEFEYRIMLEANGDEFIYVNIWSALVGVTFGEATGYEYANSFAQEILDQGKRACHLVWNGSEPKPNPLMAQNGWVT